MSTAMANDRRTTNDDGGEKHLGRCRWDGGLDSDRERGENAPTDWALDDRAECWAR